MKNNDKSIVKSFIVKNIDNSRDKVTNPRKADRQNNFTTIKADNIDIYVNAKTQT